MKPGATGLRRLLHAAIYSWRGLKATWKYEEAFRLESLLAAVGIPTSIWLARNSVDMLLLILPLLLLLLTELLNSAVEAIIDRMGEEHHELSGRAKDMGSAAVLMAWLIALSSWSVLLWDIL